MSKHFQENKNRKGAVRSETPDEQVFRIACDRCHGQKLRCLREAGIPTQGGCKRCHRAGVICTTSPPRRMGRPMGTKVGKASKSTRKIAPKERLAALKHYSLDRPAPSIASSTPSLAGLEENRTFRDPSDRSLSSQNQPLGFPTTMVPDYNPSNEDIFNATTTTSSDTWPNAFSWDSPDPFAENMHVNDDYAIDNNMPFWTSGSLSPPSGVSSLDIQHMSHFLEPESFPQLRNAENSVFVPVDAPPKTTNEVDTRIPLLFEFEQDNLEAFPTVYQLNPALYGDIGDIGIQSGQSGSIDMHDAMEMGKVPKPGSTTENSPDLDNDPREECVLQFSRLNLSLYRQLRDITLGPWTLTSAQNFGTKAFPTSDILASSQDFLRLLDEFSPRTPSTTSDCVTTPSSDTSTPSGMRTDRSLSTGSLEFELPCDGMDLETTTSIKSSTSQVYTSSSEKIQPDTPTVLYMITCYIHLLRIYNSLFVYIYQSALKNSPAFLDIKNSSSSLEPNSGPHLPNHSNLQLIIGVKMSIHYLDTMDRKLRDLAGRDLMDILLGMGAKGGEMGTLRRDIKRLEGLLKDYLGL